MLQTIETVNHRTDTSNAEIGMRKSFVDGVQAKQAGMGMLTFSREFNVSRMAESNGTLYLSF